MNAFIFGSVGLITGIFSGLIGIGGAVILIPVLVFIFKFTQQQAQGTTLAMMVPPIGFLAAYTYYKAGHTNLKVAGLLAIGFFVGGFLGAKLATVIPNDVLRRIFGIVILLMSLRMILGK